MKEPLIFLLGIAAFCTVCMTLNVWDFYLTSITEVRLLRRHATLFFVSTVVLIATIITFLHVAKP